MTVGQGLRKNTNAAMAAVAKADVSEAQKKIQMDAQEDAAKTSTISTFGGMGAAVGVNKYLGLQAAKTAAAGGAAAGGAAAGGAVSGSTVIAGAGGTLNGVAAGYGGALGAGAVGGAAGGGAAIAAPVAGGAAGGMAGLAAIAAPVAIAIGIGYLFSEIF